MKALLESLLGQSSTSNGILGVSPTDGVICELAKRVEEESTIATLTAATTPKIKLEKEAMSAEKVFDEMLLRDEEVKVVKHMCVSLTEDYKPMEATHGLNGIDDSVQELTMSYVVETLLANGLDNKPPKVIVLSPIIGLDDPNLNLNLIDKGNLYCITDSIPDIFDPGIFLDNAMILSEWKFPEVALFKNSEHMAANIDNVFSVEILDFIMEGGMQGCIIMKSSITHSSSAYTDDHKKDISHILGPIEQFGLINSLLDQVLNDKCYSTAVICNCLIHSYGVTNYLNNQSPKQQRKGNKDSVDIILKMLRRCVNVLVHADMASRVIDNHEDSFSHHGKRAHRVTQVHRKNSSVIVQFSPIKEKFLIATGDIVIKVWDMDKVHWITTDAGDLPTMFSALIEDNVMFNVAKEAMSVFAQTSFEPMRVISHGNQLWESDVLSALAIKGNSAYLNFPEIAHELPRPTSASPKDIPALSYTKRREVKAPTVPSHDTEDSSLINNDEAFIDLPDLLLDMNLQIDELWGSESWKLAASDYAAENGLEYEEPRLMEYF
ncbi:hypothetical protein V6N11_081838 [Hibiscus sabdariffa]|uniref:Uncharacterized protein n=1 Tax=Hibiscus sabdariffa TaxID=183260 RepID=A0ABR2Q7C4_9ROSI